MSYNYLVLNSDKTEVTLFERNIPKIRSTLFQSEAEKCVHPFVISCLSPTQWVVFQTTGLHLGNRL